MNSTKHRNCKIRQIFDVFVYVRTDLLNPGFAQRGGQMKDVLRNLITFGGKFADVFSTATYILPLLHLFVSNSGYLHMVVALVKRFTAN